MTGVIGFSGSRGGLTRPQLDAVSAILALAQPAVLVMGAGPGVKGRPSADAQSVTICRQVSPQTRIVARPGKYGMPRNPPFPGCDQVHPARDFLPRDRDIAQEIGALIAAPDCTPPRYRSGTATTMRYTAELGTRVMLVDPYGRVSLWGQPVAADALELADLFGGAAS